MSAIDDLYARIPTFTCKPGCTDCCGPVPFTKEEWERMPEQKQADSLDCPYIVPGVGCGCYQHRPLMCRLYGTVKGLECPHGCAPTPMLSALEEYLIMTAYLALGGGQADLPAHRALTEREAQP